MGNILVSLGEGEGRGQLDFSSQFDDLEENNNLVDGLKAVLDISEGSVEDARTVFWTIILLTDPVKSGLW
mgnify:CR=1 FL=1